MLDSPNRLTALTIAAILLACAGFIAGNVPPVHGSLPLLALCFLCVVIGYLGMLWASYTLRQDVRNERWPEDILAPFRRVTDHPLWKIGMGLLFVAMCVVVALQDRHHRTWFWAVFFLLQAQTQISNAFARPRTPRGSGARIDWSKVAPLRSEHWGER